jgi:hypothetical protein
MWLVTHPGFPLASPDAALGDADGAARRPYQNPAAARKRDRIFNLDKPADQK